MNLKRWVNAALLLMCVAWASSYAQRTVRSEQNFDFDWRFQLGDNAGYSAAAYDDNAWRKLDVPHDWSIEGKYDEENPGVGATGFLPAGIGWYRKAFDVTPAMLEGNVTLWFDGVFMDSTVWVNGQQLGNERYGYSSFFYELAPHLHPGRNVVAVRVNNLLQPAARWYTGSGVYGHTKLLLTSKTRIPLLSTSVETENVSAERATVKVGTAVESAGAKATRLTLTVLDGDKQVATQEVALGKNPVPTLQHPALLTVAHPQLWSLESPRLYTLRVQVWNGRTLLDAEDTSFGIRTMRFDAQKGFLLNGRPVKLKGVADHLFAGVMGAAIPDAVQERMLRELKAMGVNAIRTAHNPRTPFFYDLCDRMGILVMDEIYDGWHTKVKNEFADRFFTTEQWHQDVERWVRRDRNHPSIFIWSVGNETGLEDTLHMTEYVHTFDPTRPTTGGMMTTGVDIPGFNGPGENPGVLEKFHQQHPEVPVILTEEPHTLQTRGYYRVRTWWRDWKPGTPFPAYGDEEIFFDGAQWYNSSYDNATPRMTVRGTWKRTASTPWIAGEFRWTAFDYLGEAAFKGGHWPARAGNFGVIDLAQIPKDHYFLYQSFWTSKPMVHLLPHWTHPGMNGITIPVVAYSNQPEVELFLNGTSLGRRKPEALGDFVWRVPYKPGRLEAFAYDANGKQVASMAFETAGEPNQLQAETDNASLKADRLDVAQVTWTVADAKGVMVPWDMNRIGFKVNGPVNVLGYENGDPLDVTAHRDPWRKAFYGMARGFYQATAEDGPIDVTAAAILGDVHLATTSAQHPRMVSIAATRVALRGALPQANVEVHYTLDGSEPTAASPAYTKPFAIHDDTLVRALVLKDGKPELMLTQPFHRTDDLVVTDPRWATNLTQDPADRTGRRAAEGAAGAMRELQKK